MMLAQPLSASRVGATARPAAARANSRLVCVASAQQHNQQAHAQPSGILSAALAASLVVSPALVPPSAFAAAPKAETESFGASRTRELIESQGTPGAVRPDNMKTNVPFQAPGINAAPRGPKQESGSNVKNVLKDAGRSIKANAKDPDSKPFGISTGPLVKEAKKMNQPGDLRNLQKAGASRFKDMASDSPALQAVESVPSNSDTPGVINGRFTRWFSRSANKD